MNQSVRLVVSLDNGSWDGLSLTVVHTAREVLGDTPPVVVWRRGRMDPHLRAVGDVLLVDDLNERRLSRCVETTPMARLGAWNKNRLLRRWLRTRRPIDGVLAVGIPAARLAAFVPGPRPAVLCVVRPDEAVDHRAVTITCSLHVTFIVGTPEQRTALRELGIPDDDVVLDPLAVVPVPAALRSEAGTRPRPPAQTLEVVAAGTQDWWSDPDPFFLLIWLLQQAAAGRHFHATWLAPLADADDLWPFEHERRNCGLEHVITVDSSPTPIDALDRGNLLLVTGQPQAFHHTLVNEARHQDMPIVKVDDDRLDLASQLEQLSAWLDVAPRPASPVSAPISHLVQVVTHRLGRIAPGRS